MSWRRNVSLGLGMEGASRASRPTPHRSPVLQSFAGAMLQTGLTILDLLLEGHLDRHLLNVDARLLPAEVLDGMGDVKLRLWVCCRLSDRIAKE